MYIIPRSMLDEANNNPDIKLDQPAFYMLLGGSAEFAELPQAYIGHAESGETGACWDSMGVIKQCQDLHFRAGRQD